MRLLDRLKDRLKRRWTAQEALTALALSKRVQMRQVNEYIQQAMQQGYEQGRNDGLLAARTLGRQTQQATELCKCGKQATRRGLMGEQMCDACAWVELRERLGVT